MPINTLSGESILKRPRGLKSLYKDLDRRKLSVLHQLSSGAGELYKVYAKANNQRI